MGYESILDVLESEGILVSGWADQQMFRCPAHDDRKASGSITEGKDGRALLYCHAGCRTEDIVEALGLEMKDLFDDERRVTAEYEYQDEEGVVLYRVLRFRPKGFTQERYERGQFVPGLNGVRRVLYRLPEVTQAAEVYIVEGEKDVERLRTEGVTATCNVGGANVWRPEWSESLRGKDIIIVPDGDGPGEKHARAIQAALDGVANRTRLAYPASGKDVSDHLDAGYSLSQLREEPSPDEAFEPLDWETYEAPETEWLYYPYIPTRGRVLVFGKAGSLKSLWVMWIATRLARQGKKVAYFSLEMRPEQTVARLRKLQPPRSRFKVFTNYRMGDDDFRRRTIEALKGFDLIVVDSWNSAYQFTRGGTHDDQVAELDSDFFQPIIDGTGASLVVLDNTGHDVVVGFGSKIQSQHARGSSAKGDKMDVTIFLTRPDEGNNYLTEVHVKKMRYDIPIPPKRLLVAPSDHDGIEFFHADGLGQRLSSAWDVEDEVVEGIRDANGDANEQMPNNEATTGDGGGVIHRTGQLRGMGDVPGQHDHKGNKASAMGIDNGRGVDVSDNASGDRMEKREHGVPGVERDQPDVGPIQKSDDKPGRVSLRANEDDEKVEGKIDADVEVEDPFKGWTASEKLAFLKAQRFFEELSTDE